MTQQNGAGFNADDRAKKRENQLVTIGGEKFKPRRRTSKVMRGFRAIARQDVELERELDSLEADQLDEREELEEKRETLVYTMVEPLLVPAKEGGQEPTPEFLAEHLDIEEVGDLIDFLTPGAAREDPTPETAATSS